MNDYRTLPDLIVQKDGVVAGRLERRPNGAEFIYDQSFLKSSSEGIAYRFPLREEPFLVEGIANLHPFFANLLPEGVMLTIAERRFGRIGDDLFALLAASGFDAIGDVSVHIPGEAEREPRGIEESLRDLQAWVTEPIRPDPFAAIAGVQPKLSVGELLKSGRTKHWILKLDHPRFPGIGDNELYCLNLAKKAGLNVPEAVRRENALLVRRFDRTEDGRKVHVEDALQLLDYYPRDKYMPHFDEIVDVVSSLGVAKFEISKLIVLYGFSWLIGNTDLHAKNITFIYDPARRNWTLSPTYDLVCTLPFMEDGTLVNDPRAALMLDETNEQWGEFTLADLTRFGAKYGIPALALERSLRRATDVVLAIDGAPWSLTVTEGLKRRAHRMLS